MKQTQALPAAVFDETDPRASQVARAVPANAERITIGSTTLGYRNKPATFHKVLTWQEVAAYQRQNELARLVQYRHDYGGSMGSAIGWSQVLADITAALGKEVNVTSIADRCRLIRLSANIDVDVMAGAASVCDAKRWQRPYRMLSAATVGAYVELTSVEREDCGIVRIDAYDESSADRKRRLTRERVARHRERQRVSGKQSPEQTRGVTRTLSKEGG